MNNLENLEHLGPVVKALKELGAQEVKTKRNYGNGFGNGYKASGAVEKYNEMVEEVSPKVLECEEMINEVLSLNDQLTHTNNKLIDKIVQLEKRIDRYESRNFFQRLFNLD